MQSYKPFILKVVIINSIVISVLLLVWLSSYLSWNNGIEKLHANANQQLDQFIDHLNTRLERFQVIPQLVAKNQQLVELLRDPNNSPRIDLVNRFLEEVNQIIGASDTYLMDKQGLTLAASNWQKDKPFVGRNFSFRPYFIDAMKGQLGRYFALGTTSGKRGYYFAYPIIYAAEVIGVIVVKMDLANIEQNWSNRAVRFNVIDEQGVIFITTQAKWLYNSIMPLSEQELNQIAATKRYSQKAIKPLNYQVQKQLELGSKIVQLVTPNEPKQDYLVLQQPMLQAGWSVMILAPLDDVKKNQNSTILVLLLVSSLVLLSFYLAWQKHKRQLQEAKFLQQAQKNLEHEVKLRTSDLSHEIEEHKRTETLLQETQGELIQTAKLAVLGQMSASISHELNNPLAAIRSYTDNARKYLSLNNVEQVVSNLLRISDLTDRMGKISSQLKFFARKSSGVLEAVQLSSVIKSAIDISYPQFKSFDIQIDTAQIKSNLWVKADKIQLEQVLINLLNNAMFAIGDQPDGQVVITTFELHGKTIVQIDDNGPGIDQQNLSKVFDPFFTTRKSGMGLGLSISARIIESLQGTLSVQNIQPHGARFCINLLSEKPV